MQLRLWALLLCLTWNAQLVWSPVVLVGQAPGPLLLLHQRQQPAAYSKLLFQRGDSQK